MMKDYSKEIKHYKKQVITMLKEMNLLDGADESSLQLLWDTYRVYLMCRDEIFEDGVTQQGMHGKIQHPSVNMMMSASKTMMNIMKDFGVTPKARQLMLGVTPEDENSPLNEFLKNAI